MDSPPRLLAAVLLLAEVQAMDPQDVVFAQASTTSTSAISASKVTFSLQDIEESSAFLSSPENFLLAPPDSVRQSFLSGTLVVPCLILAIMVVSAILLTALLAEDEKEVERYDLPIRIPVPGRRKLNVLETIQEQPNCCDVEAAR